MTSKLRYRPQWVGKLWSPAFTLRPTARNSHEHGYVYHSSDTFTAFFVQIYASTRV